MNEAVKQYLSEIGAKGGKVRSAAKATAVKANAKLGGAPKGNQNWKGRLKNTAKAALFLPLAWLMAGCPYRERPQPVAYYPPPTVIIIGSPPTRP